ncbi:MAG TPA: Mg2+ and Co2+ transporter CorB [Opitutae bacterium]|nr:Mg2+ and Co2+ transporter CorB [Opitutae bacterium]
MSLFSSETASWLPWLAIVFCLLQSGVFSGLNIAMLSLNRLQLEVEAGNNNKAAAKVLHLRGDSNFLLATILWGNVGINVLLTLLSDSVMAGLTAFAFSTLFITMFGEIIPQAYFSRHSLRMAAILSPVLRFYQFMLFPVAKPTALLLDQWLGKEGVNYMRERDLRQILRRHVEADEADVEHLEGMGALNFLEIDVDPVSSEGELLEPLSILKLPVRLDLPVFPEYKASPEDPFLQRVQASHMKWVVLTDTNEAPLLVLDADGFLRSVLFNKTEVDPYKFCHRPIIVTNPDTPVGDIVWKLKSWSRVRGDGVIDNDIVLLWGKARRIITGADILGRLLRGVEPKAKSSDESAQD